MHRVIEDQRPGGVSEVLLASPGCPVLPKSEAVLCCCPQGGGGVEEKANLVGWLD